MSKSDQRPQPPANTGWHPDLSLEEKGLHLQALLGCPLYEVSILTLLRKVKELNSFFFSDNKTGE